MKQTYFSDLLKRYLHDDCTTGEAWTVEQWYEARDMPRPTPATPAEAAATKAKMWRRVQAQTQAKPALWHSAGMRWAAAALLVMGLGVWLLPLQQRPSTKAEAAKSSRALPSISISKANGWLTCSNPTRRPARVALADGSTVALQPGSSLRYPEQFIGPERQVNLSGEAFFEVFHDPSHPFRVLTDKLETTVLGTSFTVRAFPGQAEATVMVRTGRVRVNPKPGANTLGTAPAGIVLLPNQQVVYSRATPQLHREMVPEPALLQPQQLLAYDERPVAEVLTALQTAYGVPILYDGAALAGCTVSLAFGEESLFEKLDVLCQTLGASYERAGEKIIFRSRGCHSE